MRRTSVTCSNIVKVYFSSIQECWKDRNRKVHGKLTLRSSMTAANVLSVAMTKANPMLDSWAGHFCALGFHFLPYLLVLFKLIVSPGVVVGSGYSSVTRHIFSV
ncbi:hypothetical protein MA16_Dca018306 [Dendrobium catenatum]|uniref:Uncharacterized protein n=1 Tax=Dendrobium catenatum TaxID=906689 RepID=A0A2I0WJG2_9ASPA|nr:hypothetical protein MA16_Dca018306 [Dendrobium catenatum]